MTTRRFVVALLSLGLVALFIFQANPSGNAQRFSDIGVINLEAIWAEFIFPALDAPLANETARLQAELDELVQNKPEAEKRRLHEEYQGRLYTLQQTLVDELLDDVRRAIAAVADDMGVTTVLDEQVVMYGGVDVTQAVLQRLANEE